VEWGVEGNATREPVGVREEKIKINHIASHPVAAQSWDKNACPAAQQVMGFEVNRVHAKPQGHLAQTSGTALAISLVYSKKLYK
jgi:hypothetical protein